MILQKKELSDREWFYGVNFVDYVGYLADELVMIRPVNGQNYDSFF